MALDKRQIVCVLPIDLCKVFDCFPHQLFCPNFENIAYNITFSNNLIFILPESHISNYNYSDSDGGPLILYNALLL